MTLVAVSSAQENPQVVMYWGNRAVPPRRVVPVSKMASDDHSSSAMPAPICFHDPYFYSPRQALRAYVKLSCLALRLVGAAYSKKVTFGPFSKSQLTETLEKLPTAPSPRPGRPLAAKPVLIFPSPAEVCFEMPVFGL